MTYTITTTAGATIATIADGTVNTTATSLTLIGKNYAGYGIFLNENYIQLLENFSNSTPPPAPLTGQLWYDNVNDILKVYNADSNTWKPISSSISQGTAPSSVNSVTGDIWWDTTNAQLKVWSGSAWITIGPAYTSTSGTSGPVTESILDNTGNPHVVTKFYVSNSVIGIMSKDATFTPQTPIPGFSTIIPGFNLISQSTLAGAQFTGATTSATTLGGLTASQFLRSDIAQTTNYTFGAAGGLTVGSHITPTANVSYNIGSTTSRFASVWATTFYGQAISAQYADLAERFESDTTYPAGTVVALGGVKEITAAQEELTEDVFGVISTRAAFLMNGEAGNDATHPPVAVQGRVPVRVVGRVKKGDRLVSAGLGVARAAVKGEYTAFNVIGRALEDKITSEEGTVEAIVKLNS